MTGNRVVDVFGVGVNVGEFDDFWLTDAARMTSGNEVDNNAISYVGQDYEDAVGIAVGYARTTTIAHNEVSILHTRGSPSAGAGPQSGPVRATEPATRRRTTSPPTA